MKTSAKDYLNSLGIKPETTSFVTVINAEPTEVNLAKLLEGFAELRLKEDDTERKLVYQNGKPEISKKDEFQSTLIIEVKNIDCNFDYLRNKIDKINPRFTLDKDTFIFHDATEDLFIMLTALKKEISKSNRTIVVTKN